MSISWPSTSPSRQVRSRHCNLRCPSRRQLRPRPDSGLQISDLVAAADDEAARAADAAAQAAAEKEAQAASQVYGGDDLTQISGIGLSWERKLKAAGVLTYGQLAALPVEFLAAIVGATPEEVIEDKILQQAANLTATK